ncbi:MAG TPA: hypothetical protein VHA52_01835, partial [Candidatus Babeliaceae bacterium]|nr:hypothetical protein [Candidatus Babeliaceae bacterium]
MSRRLTSRLLTLEAVLVVIISSLFNEGKEQCDIKHMKLFLIMTAVYYDMFHFKFNIKTIITTNSFLLRFFGVLGFWG